MSKVPPQLNAVVEWNPPFPPPPVAPPKKRRATSLVFSLIVVGVLIIGVPGLALWAGHDDIARADPGDCLLFTGGLDQPYRVADCADSSAAFVLLATKPTTRECIDVPGASRTVTGEKRSYCIGDKGVDVSKAINGIEAGECLAFEQDKPSKTTCRNGVVPVLLVLSDIDKTLDSEAMGALCVERGAKDVERVYTWGIYAAWESETVGTWHRLICLGSPQR